MTTTSNLTQHAKESALCAMAQQSSDFQQFCEQYQWHISTETPLPAILVDDVFAIVESDSSAGSKIRCFAENSGLSR